NPFLPEGIASRTFDAEGVPTSKCKVVDHGKLTTFFHNQQTAKKDGVSSTGHGGRHSYKGALQVSPSNFFVVTGRDSLEALHSSMYGGIINSAVSALLSGADEFTGGFSFSVDCFCVSGHNVGGSKPVKIVGEN